MPRTSFRPETDGFAFDNSWSFDADERRQILEITQSAVNVALVLLHPIFGGALALFGVGNRIAEWVTNAIAVQSYGLCAGMAFAALDYHKGGLVVPRGAGTNDQPTRVTTEGGRLRAYLWQRLLDDHRANVPTFLGWMAVLHLIPKEWPFSGGHPWLLDRSREQWEILKGHIDAGHPWPIGLMTSSSDPFDHHVVLAYGYDDPGDGTGTIYVYENNAPSSEHTFQVDFNGEMLGAGGSRQYYGGVRAFFCQDYAFVFPPIAVGLSEGLTTSTLGPVPDGGQVTLAFRAQNVGFGPSPPLALAIASRPLANPRESSMFGIEAGPTAIPFGDGRTGSVTLTLSGTPGPRRFSSVCYLGQFGGIDIWRNVPAVAAGTSAAVDVVVEKIEKEKDGKEDKDTKEDDKIWSKDKERPGKEMMKEKDRDDWVAAPVGLSGGRLDFGFGGGFVAGPPRGRPFIRPEERPAAGQGTIDDANESRSGGKVPPPVG